jgi:formyl-CoA transferase
VLIENFKPGTLEGWGLGWEVLQAINPGLVMLRISGFGQTRPYAGKPGFGVLGEAMGGLRHLTGEPGRVPVRVGVSIGDTLAALHGVIGVLLALRHREVNGGHGQVIDVALYESVFNVMESLLPEYDAFGAVRGAAGSALPGIAPSNAYRCAGDAWVLVAGNGDSIFRRLMKAIGRDDLAEDPGPGAQRRPRDARGRDRRGHRRVDGRHAPSRQVIATLEAAGVPVGRIDTVADIAQDPQYLARGMIVQTADARRPAAEGARHRAQALGHAGAAAHARPGAWGAHRRRAGGAGHRCGTGWGTGCNAGCDAERIARFDPRCAARSGAAG